MAQPLPTTYAFGTVTVTQGSTVVTGTGVLFQTAVQAGDRFWTPEGNVTIADVPSQTSLQLAWPWNGPTITDGPYEIRLTGDVTRAQEASRRIFERLLQGSYAQPGATGTLAERAEFDAAAKGFIYWQTDVTPFLIFVKQSAASGDWSEGTSVQGGVGPEGKPGTNGVGDKYDVVFQDPGRAAAGELVFSALFANRVNFVANLIGSYARASVAATAQANWSLRKNGAQFGTMRFAAGAVTATFISTATQFQPGDELTVVAPAARDDTLTNIRGVLAGTR